MAARSKSLHELGASTGKGVFLDILYLNFQHAAGRLFTRSALLGDTGGSVRHSGSDGGKLPRRGISNRSAAKNKAPSAEYRIFGTYGTVND